MPVASSSRGSHARKVLTPPPQVAVISPSSPTSSRLPAAARGGHYLEAFPEGVIVNVRGTNYFAWDGDENNLWDVVSNLGPRLVVTQNGETMTFFRSAPPPALPVIPTVVPAVAPQLALAHPPPNLLSSSPAPPTNTFNPLAARIAMTGITQTFLGSTTSTPPLAARFSSANSLTARLGAPLSQTFPASTSSLPGLPDPQHPLP